jgi:hypothetical protein
MTIVAFSPDLSVYNPRWRLADSFRDEVNGRTISLPLEARDRVLRTILLPPIAK